MQIKDDGGLDYTIVIGEPPVSLHQVAYIFLRDSLSQYIADGNEPPMSEIPRGAYNWVPPPVALSGIDLQELEAGSIYNGSDGPV